MAKKIDLEIFASSIASVNADGHENMTIELTNVNAEDLISNLKDYFSAKEIIQNCNLEINDFIEFFSEDDILKEIGEDATVKYFGL